MRFTVHRPANAGVSPCCHRPSGGDVACGVHVGIARPRVAGDALENRLALTVFRCDVPAAGASLRRVRCWNEFQPAGGLVLQSGHQQSPPLAADLTVEAPFLRDAGARAVSSAARRAGHRTHLQVLDADGVEASRQIGAGLVHPVTAAICFTGAQPPQWRALFVRAGEIRVALGPDAAATGAAAAFRRHEGQQHAAAPRWTAQPRPLRRDPHQRRCRHWVPGQGRAWQQKRCATAQTDPR